jgi:hypothetical protein
VVEPSSGTFGKREVPQSWARSHDAPRRDAGELFDALEFCGECISIWTRWAAYDAAAKIVPGVAGRVVPWLVVSHRAFDGKEPLIVIGDNEEERFARSVVGHRLVSHDSERDRLKPGGLCRAPEGTTGRAFGDGVIMFKGVVHHRASNLEHQVRAVRCPAHLLLGIHPAM